MADITVVFYEHDPLRPLESGKNPIQIAQRQIPDGGTYPRRERAARAEAAQVFAGSPPMTVNFCPNGNVLVTATVSRAPPATATQAAAARASATGDQIMEALQDPATAARVRLALGIRS